MLHSFKDEMFLAHTIFSLIILTELNLLDIHTKNIIIHI